MLQTCLTSLLLPGLTLALARPEEVVPAPPPPLMIGGGGGWGVPMSLVDYKKC